MLSHLKERAVCLEEEDPPGSAPHLFPRGCEAVHQRGARPTIDTPNQPIQQALVHIATGHTANPPRM